MPNELQLPYYTIGAADLAQWLAQQPNCWWNVDGDPVLTSLVDFPCPSGEIAEAVGKLERTARVFDPREDAHPNGEPIDPKQLNELANTENNSHARTFLLRWESGEVQWLLAEDPDAAGDAA